MVSKEESESSMDSIVKMCCAEEGCEPGDLPEVVLDEESLPKLTKADMSGDISKCKSLTLINLTCCGLTEIQAPFPELPNVETLDLSENKLTADVIDKLVNLSALRLLLLRGNSIETVEEFKALRDIKSLQVIDLEGCPVVQVDNYRKKIFDMLEQVEVIDDKGRDGEDVDMTAILGLKSDDADGLLSDGSNEVLDAIGRDELRWTPEMRRRLTVTPMRNDKSEDEEDVDPDIPPIVGVKEQDEDPLKATRLAVDAYSKDAKALCQTLQAFAKANDELDGVRGDVVKTAKAFLLPMDQQGRTAGCLRSRGQLGCLTKVGNLFSSEVDSISHSKKDTRQLLDDAVSEASAMQRRLDDLTTAFNERDKAAELMSHYKIKMQALSEEHISKPKKDMDDRIKRNLVKQQNAVEAYKRVDTEVRTEANQMCTYIAKNSKSQAAAIPAFEEQIPAMVQESKDNLQKTRAAREEAAKAAEKSEKAPTTPASAKESSAVATPTASSAEGDHEPDKEPSTAETKDTTKPDPSPAASADQTDKQ
ncbi:hypothetical protein FOZ60_002742 [Perkinsus olseni]|uniref:Uncharacterized protein n=1 Tax=Perkinsus olseni TaxID=32597 RepID=A0A7J6PKB4_PEROL|nr:hypothetical protein FOZ60_002742 [Perkinsus olseni]